MKSLLLLSLLCGRASPFAPSFKSSHKTSPAAFRVQQLHQSSKSTTASTTTTSASAATTTTDWISNYYNADASSATMPRDRCVIGPKEIIVYDTSLRDGTQGESVSASVDDKLKICKRLAAFDVDFIECGWPGSNPKDAAFFERAKTELTAKEREKISAFGSTRRKNVDVQADSQVKALLESEAPTICLVAKADHWQVTEILKATPEENLEMITDTVQYLVRQGRRVLVDLEHFFDGYNNNPEYALKCCEAAADAGASGLVLCDTNGGSMPWALADTCRKIVKHFGGLVTIGIHCHNDCGMAVANSVIAAHNGVGMIQGTINGIGERTGNADLCSIVPSLALHGSSNMTCNPNLPELTQLSRYVDEILNRKPISSAPFVGASAFAHKGGLHVAAMERSPLSYQHIMPEQVGNEKRILISELSGRQNIIDKINEVGVDMGESATKERSLAILHRVKELEAKGYTFEGAEASVHLMILHMTTGYCPPFRVLDYVANVYDNHIDSASRVVRDAAEGDGPTARATVKVRTTRGASATEDGSSSPIVDRLEVSDGNGPVDALAGALLRALLPSHPSLCNVELSDYKVRILDPQSATGATTRVMIEFKDKVKESSWTTVSVDTNVISASLNALVDGFEYALIENADSCMLCEDSL